MNFSRRAVVWFAAIIVIVNGFFPAVWILLTSLKTETELIRFPITYLPEAATLENYATAFTAQPIGRFLLNSFVVASLSTALCVLVSALAAYALTRLRMPQRNLIMSLLLAIAMVVNASEFWASEGRRAARLWKMARDSSRWSVQRSTKALPCKAS